MKVLFILCLSIIANQAYTQTSDIKSCDTIVLKMGNKLPCRIDSLTKTHIYYHDCLTNLHIDSVPINWTDSLIYSLVMPSVPDRFSLNVVKTKNSSNVLVLEAGDKASISHLNESGEVVKTKGKIYQIGNSEISIDSTTIEVEEIIRVGKMKNKKLKLGGLITGSGLIVIGGVTYFVIGAIFSGGGDMFFSAAENVGIMFGLIGGLVLTSTGVYSIIEGFARPTKKNNRDGGDNLTHDNGLKYSFTTVIVEKDN